MLKSPKDKGSSFEREIVNKIREAGLDKYARRSIMSGAAFEPADLHTSLPYAIECKNLAKMAIYKLWDQAKRQATASKLPLLVTKANFKPALAILDFDHFLELYAWAQKGGYKI